MTLYEIVFSGQLVPGAQLEKVKANLGKLFQADAQRLELLFSGRRLVLKNNLDAPSAEKYRATMERAGAVAEVVDMHPEMEEVELAPPPDAPTWLRKAKGEGSPSAPEVSRPQPEKSRQQPDDGRLQIVPRDAYMAAFTDVDAPNYSVAQVGSDMQDPKPQPVAPKLDLSRLSLAPAGSDMGQTRQPPAAPAPDTSHLKLV